LKTVSVRPKIRELDGEDFVDFIEIVVEQSAEVPKNDSGEIRKVSSPGLDAEVVGPALLTVARPR
jgi:hypothetical protein